jgi:kinesin family protein 5
VTVSPGIGIRSWSFGKVFGESTTQQAIYDDCGFHLATDFVNGRSGALIAYGQTGSGKTTTMFGSPQQADGLVPRIADEILAALDTRRKVGVEVTLGTSYVEVFGNDVTNLLGGAIGKNRGQSQRMAHKYVLDGKCEETVLNREDFSSLLTRGEEKKRKASTEMNERSTRAHSLVLLRLRQRAPGQGRVVESFLTLVDLGGSERLKKSKANEGIKAAGAINTGNKELARVSWQEYYQSRERVTETNHINQGLLALKRCVQALNKRQDCLNQGLAKLPRVPFSDSKLTMLLEPALSGEANTAIIVCCSQEDPHADETVQSLRFGEMCSAVQHDVKKGGGHDDTNAAVKEALRQIDVELQEVEGEIRAKERLEWRSSVRTDIIDEMDTGGTMCHKNEAMELGGQGAVEIAADDGASKKRTVEHVVWSQVYVGAEVENAHREDLLKRRAQLIGDD